MVRFEFLRNEKGIRTFEAGEVIFRDGEQGDTMHAVIEGEVEISRGGRVVDTVTKGGVFGEMAIIDQSPRSATAVAKTACKVASVSQQRFIFLVQETPFFALDIMKVLADRLRRNSAA